MIDYVPELSGLNAPTFLHRNLSPLNNTLKYLR